MTTPISSTGGTADTILIIESEPTERMLTRVHLERAGFRVIEASDGPEGFALAREHQPDLIILDIHLETAGGFEICRKIRADRVLCQVPVLISTGLEDTDSIADGFDAGASDFLTKPTIWALLAYRVKFLLRGARFEQELADANRLAQANAIALAENERHYRDLFDNAPVMMHRIDEQFLIRDVNHTWLEKTGYSEDEVLGHDFLEFLDGETRALFKSTIRPKVAEIGFVEDAPARIQRKNGTIIDTLLTSTREYDQHHRFVGAHAVLLDVTERNRAQQQMREAQETAEAASRAKSVFLATMSHEIRTPLNGIIGMIDLLEHTELDKNQASMTRTVRNSAYSLLHIIGDILDFSKIEAGELTVEHIDTSVANVVEGVIETLAPLARDKNIELNAFTNPTIPDLVSGDPVRIRQVLFNLIGNAIKFSERKDGQQGEVHVRADLALSATGSDPVIRFTISDTGVGISKEHIARLFTPFFQAEDSTVRRFGGTGLGLSICRNLVELMGGEISVESELGKGSTFIVNLPMTAATNGSNKQSVRLKDLRILLVAPDPASRLAAETYLAHEGALIVVADSMEAAKEMFLGARDEDWPFDAAIFSHSQPRAVDAENKVIASLCKDPATAGTGFVVLSEDRRNRTRSALPDIILVPKRPLSRSALLRAVLEAVGRPQEKTSPTRVPASMKKPAKESDLVRGLILVAEDNTINQLVIQRQLQQFGYVADLAADGDEALKAFERGNYQLLLTDCHMPEMDGFELTQAIRAKERGTGQRIPIIAITANALQGEADRCIAAGMDDYLAKPVELKKIGAMLAKWLAKDEGAGTSDGPGAEPAAKPRVPAARPAVNLIAELEDREACNPIDLSMLSRLLGTDDDAYLKEMINMYWDTMRDTPVELATLVAAQNAANLRDAAHAAKGASASVGAIPVSSLFEKLQFAAKDADWNQIEGLMPKIEIAFSELEEFIGTLETA